MGKDKIKISEKWKRIRGSSRFHDGILFLIFIVIATLFWFILALNDSAQNNFNVAVRIDNKPDSVVFINDIPNRIHVGVRDKGSTLWKFAFLKNPALTINFQDFASDGKLELKESDIVGALRNTFGSSALITSISTDSLVLYYTGNAGINVPVVLNYHVLPASGSILASDPSSKPSTVKVYGEKNIIDTIKYVFSEPIDLTNLSETTSLNVKLKKIRNVRIIPSEIEVTFPIEPLVRKESLITISTKNVPDDKNLLLFPSKVPVEYYVAMSRLSDNDDPEIELLVDYNDINNGLSDRLPVALGKYPERLKNLNLKVDSVEYAIVNR